VPNFVIQGGSPGANEYAGHKEYMRDEVGGRNGRGSVGLSTRGRNTGDAQFFINLVDNPRLNFDYTVFAQVLEQDMDVVDRIQEGDVLRSISLSKCPTYRK
jgi:cyclophilin family peptidyl-prolyl cis-trans isomerase